MISEKTREEGDFLSAWVIHFSPAGSKTSVFREKLMNPSNIHFWENTTRVEGNQFDFIYFLTQMFLTKDIETLQRIILEPEEIHELVQQTASVRKSLNEYGEFDETSYRTEIDRMPYIGCNFIDERCISFELLVTDHFDPDHNLRNLLGDLRTSRTVTRNETQEGRDAFCVTSHNSTKCIGDKENTQSPHSQTSKEFWRKGSRNRDPTVVQEDIVTSQSPSKSQKSKSVENNSPQITQKRSRKRRRSFCDRKSFQGKIPKMNTIDTYFKPIPKRSQRGYIKNKKENERSNSRELEIYIIDDDDCDSSNEFTRNVLHNDHMGREKQNFLIDELHSLEIDCFQEDNIALTEKSRTSSLKSIESEESDTDICVTHQTLQDCHGKQVTESSTMNAERLLNSNRASPVVCSENHDTQATISMDANNIDLYPNVKSTFKLDAATRKLIRDWCGGDTFLTQDSSDRTTDDDDDDDNGNKHDNQNNGKIDGDNDNNNVIHRHPDDHKGHCENDKGDEKSDDDDDDSEDNDDNDVLNRDPDDHKGHCENGKGDENSDDDDDDDSEDNDDNDVLNRDPDDHKGHCENDKGDENSDDDDDDDSEDNDDNNVFINRDPDDRKGHGGSDKSVENSDDDHDDESGNNDDSDDDESDDDDNESDNDESDHESDDGESDDDNDEDYIYDSDDKSDSDSDDIDKKRKV